MYHHLFLPFSLDIESNRFNDSIFMGESAIDLCKRFYEGSFSHVAIHLPILVVVVGQLEK